MIWPRLDMDAFFYLSPVNATEALKAKNMSRGQTDARCSANKQPILILLAEKNDERSD